MPLAKFLRPSFPTTLVVQASRLPLCDSADGIYDRVEYKCNRQGELIELKDQNETIYVYSYDALGRQTSDRVTTLGDSIDNAVLRIEVCPSIDYVAGIISTSYQTVLYFGCNSIWLRLPSRSMSMAARRLPDSSSG